jgi:hypothetical protein
MTAKYFTTADGRIVRGEIVSLPVLAVNSEFGVGLAVYLGEASSLSDATLMAWGQGFQPLEYDHRPSPKACLKASNGFGFYSVIASNGETYHEWIEVPVAAKVIAE